MSHCTPHFPMLPDGGEVRAINLLECYGGEGGIRTPGTVFDRTTV